MGSIIDPASLLVTAPSIIIPKSNLPPSAQARQFGNLIIPKGRDNGVQLMVDHLNDHAEKYIRDGSWDQMGLDERFQTLSPKERTAVLDQARLCRDDFIYTARNFFWISNDRGEDQLFTLWESQWLLLQKFNELKKRGRAVKIMILKARQLGMSLLIEAMIAWRTMFFRNTAAIVVSVDEEQSSYLFGLMLHFYNKMPWWLKPEAATLEVKGGLHFDRKDRELREREPGMNSHVYVQHANQLSGVGQGKLLRAAHVCFSPDTLVRVNSGRLKAITEVMPGDTVVTSRGRVMPVKGVWKSERENEPTQEIYPWGSYAPLSTTIDHRIHTSQGWRQAQDVKAGDYVRTPIRPITNSKKSVTIISQLPGRPYYGVRDNGRYQGFELDYNFGWMLGSYLAEGSIQFNKKLATEYQPCAVFFGIDFEEEQRVRDGIARVMGKDQHVSGYRHKSRTLCLKMNHSAMARFIEREFGSTDQKRIPDWIWECGEDFCKGIVHGYLLGDGSGSAKQGTRVSATSTRESLVIQLRDLLASLGYGWSALSYRSAGNRYGRNCKSCWVLGFSGHGANRIREEVGWRVCRGTVREEQPWRESVDGKFMEVLVEKTKAGFSETFYDLEVDAEEHDFCTLQCNVLNSEYTDFQQAKAKEIIEGDLLHSIHDNDPNSFGFLESTGRGAGSYSHMLWKANVKMGIEAEWYPIFLPFFLERSRFVPPPQGWHIDKPEALMLDRVKSEWVVCPECRQYHVAKFGGESRVGTICPACDKGTLEPAILSDGQLRWKELKRKNAEAKDKESVKLHHQETSCTAEDAWQLSGYAVFDEQCQDMMTMTIRDPDKSPDVKVGYLDSKGQFHGCKFERARDGSKELKMGCWQNGCTADHRTSKLYEDESTFIIWEDPIPGREYAIGVDIAEGIGEDYSVIAVNKLGKGGSPDEQVAVWRSNDVEPLDLAYFAQAIGHMYNDALMCIEYNFYKSVADEVRGRYMYPNLFRWKHLDSKDPMSNKFHWITQPNTKPKLWQTGRKWIKAGYYVVRSPNFQIESQTFQKDDEDDKKASHAKGSHDDELLSFLIALYCAHEWEADDSGRISVPNQIEEKEPARYKMVCMACKAEWGATNPESEYRCPKCESIRLKGIPLDMPDPRGVLDSDAVFGRPQQADAYESKVSQTDEKVTDLLMGKSAGSRGVPEPSYDTY